MTGKEKCNLLRQIRKEIAKANNIPYQPDDCDYPGNDCPGTCPKCDAEIRALDTMLNRKAARGEKITVAGISLDTYQQQVIPDEAPFLDLEDDTPTGLLGYVDEPIHNTIWHLDPDTPGVMQAVDPKLEKPVKELNLPSPMQLWLSEEYIVKVSQLQEIVKYMPDRLQNENQSWYEAAVRELTKLGLDTQQPEPWFPVAPPDPDEIQGGMAPIDDDPSKFFFL